MPQINIGIVVLHYADIGATLRCIESVRSAIGFANRTIDVVVVDNDGDGPNLSLQRNVEKLGFQYISSGSNLGFGQGMNTGTSLLWEIGEYDYFWLLNNDICLVNESLFNLELFLYKNPSSKIIGPTVLFANIKEVQCYGGCQYNSWIGIDRAIKEERVAMEKNDNSGFDYIYGAAMVVRADFFRRVGGFSKRYFLYFEELELATRCTKKDMSWAQSVNVLHTGSNASKISDEVKYFCTYHAALSCFRFTQLHFPHKLFFVVLFRFVGNLTRSALRLDFGYALATLRAFVTFVK